MLGRSLFGAVALAATVAVVGCTDSTSPASTASTTAPPLLTAKGSTTTVCQTLGSSTDPKYRELTIVWRGANGVTRRGTAYVSSYFRPCPPPPDGYAPLYLCNVTTDESLVGTNIDYLVNGTRTVTLAAGTDQGAGNCTNLGLFAVGSSVTLQEQVPAGVEVAYASFSYNPPGELTDYNSATAQAIVKVGTVTNVFSFYSRPATS